METKQIISWLRDKADRADNPSWTRMMHKAADRLKELEQEQKIMTNGDRIRAMTDGELAEELNKMVYCGGCPINKGCVCDMLCEDALLLWLKEPVNVEGKEKEDD